MRIISGTHKGRRITAPANLPVRPTTDFAKEGLFNVLGNRIDFEEETVLDLFAGTGNISYELASRGCKNITCVDADARCIKFIQDTAAKFEFRNLRTMRSDVFSFIRKGGKPYSLIFADPPFDMAETAKLPGLIFQHNLLAPGGLLIIEHPDTTRFEDTSKLTEIRKYGKVHFSFFGHDKQEGE
ncbi:MAG: RsmD family RNA methyltransferase [Bacteroidia bacterium]|nr:RsmD family RNA methyltransferase [Bacteroidia bacterium]